MLWNIEGLKNAMSLAPKNCLDGYDMVILTETFLTEQWQYRDYYSMHILAKQGEKGRPKGGITVLLRPWLTPVTATIKKDHTLLIETKYITIIAAYFQPNETALDIIDELGQQLTQSKKDSPLIVAGDLNCRLDTQNYKTKLVMETMREEGLILLNNTNIPTYICHNGKSTIDIALARGPIKGEITPLWTAHQTPIRKHIPMQIEIRGDWQTTKGEAKQLLSRKIDTNKIEERPEQIVQINKLISESRLEEAVQTLEELLTQAARPRKERKAQPWFDQECYLVRKDVLQTLHQLKSYQENNTLLTTYSNKRRLFKKILREKKKTYWEEEGKRIVEEARKDPYIALRPKKQTQNQYISMEEWQRHFNNTLNRKEIKNKPGNLQEAVVQAPIQWTPLTMNEVQNAVGNTKNKKAAGPDNLYNEYLKDTAYLLIPTWTELYNKCIETATIPERWRESIIKVLYKGKGDPKDTNAYRGIALENNPFKLFTKILAERIRETIDDCLPETQLGFRRGRSTLTAIELMLNNVWEALEEKDKFYVVFIDFTKAFDLINRKLVVEKLEETLGENNKWTQIIKAILQWNKIRISDNLSLSEPILQTNGVLQGDPLSPTLFILAAEEIMRIAQKSDIAAFAYADDIAVGSRDIIKLQNTINDMEEWCSKHKFEINTSKTEMMVFRQGGRAPASAEIFIKGRKITIVNEFKYLGITLQTSAKCFTKHVTEKAAQAIRAMHEISYIRSLNLETAMALFRTKIMPVLTYGIEVIWPHLTEKNLSVLERVKALYIKRAIGVSKTTRSRLVYLLARETFLIEDLRTLPLQNTVAYENLLKSLERKREEIPLEFFGTGAMIDRTWTAANFEMRHVLTRMAVHGFHHMICNNTVFHEPSETCVCKLCEQRCERYHLELCNKRELSISEYANKQC